MIPMWEFLFWRSQYASDPSLSAKYLTLPLGDPLKEAAEKAAELRRSPNLVAQLAQAG